MVSVPQAQVAAITIGQQADIVLPDGGRMVKGVVMRTSSSLDAAARTLTVEVDAPNRDGALLAGMFGEVHFHGADVEVLTDVADGARLILNPSDDVVEGLKVHVIGNVDSRDK